MKKILALLLIALCLCLCAAASADELKAPTDFAFDTESGKLSFVSNDENAGYYFVRIYPVVNGIEANAYVSSSKRINAGKVGEKSGKVDVSAIGWGLYNVKLVTFTASGTDYTAPAPIILKAFYGVGGTLERPEMLVVADGNTVEITLDRYTLSNWKKFQYMPTVRFSLYADEACTELVASQDVATSELVIDNHPAGGYIWPYSLTTGHMNFEAPMMGPPGASAEGTQPFNLTAEGSLTVEKAGIYYVTAQAISDDEEKIASSQVSEAVKVELTEEAPDFETFEVVKTSLWADPAVMGMPTATPGQAEGRIDAAQGQTTTALIE